ncbi:sigma-70 family RNA polymerase sigma factor [Paludisphaera borealis]|uniref:ECF RNA polymerase sigma factor SigE n=1 Tax=Paludisphaera borealis TaxID=1387353 RepID=A0A1U7CRZ3_9BACT|nr:sigma-70 family RNA polymerase sigma factor [Paludisphaera borealis]APW61702.1 ECF RNA polymerase sigma factor SigE [Paludisphaera borealis]
MTTRRKNSVPGPLRTLFNVGAIGDMTDGQLLERFAIGGEAAELAFAALVERHGPVVLHACQSILRDEHDAEDAFQATFLVLVRKAGSLWVRDSLGPWLHQVAYRAARCSLSARTRRTAHAQRAAEMIAARRDQGKTDDGEEIGAALHEEIERMPERYRIPVLLCDLEGRTHEQAARHLGCPVGTIKSRLARGRQRLRDRLTRRGLVVPTGALAAGLLPPTARAAPPASWVESTTRAAMHIAAGQPPAAVVSATVFALLKGISKGLFMNSLKGTLAAVATLGILAAGAAGLAWAGLQQPSGSDAPRPAAVEEKAQVEAPKIQDTEPIDGSWRVLYLAGTVAGKREGYLMPNLEAPITGKTIDLPTLTDDPKNPINYLGKTSYTLKPGRMEADEWVKADEERLEEFRGELSWIELSARRLAHNNQPVPSDSLIMARKKVDFGEARLRNTQKRRDQRWAETTAQISQIDIAASPKNGKVRLGIYRIKDDVLTICYDESDHGRPETFADVKPSQRLIILHLRGMKLESVPPLQPE